MSKRVLVAMSGGVDSSVAALLLKDKGYDILGVTFNNLGNPVLKQSAKSDSEIAASEVATMLGISHESIDVSDYFFDNVVRYFVDEYLSGRTPNPCIKCNYLIKFGYLRELAGRLGCEYLATGHYAVIDDGKLFRGADVGKDQSYFLYSIYGREIEKILFPLGLYTKQQVRAIAAQNNLPNAAKEESQDICFVKNGEYGNLVKEIVGTNFESGPIVDCEGRKIGKHNGIAMYTIGQRKGLGALGQPMFVKEIRPDTNSIIAALDGELYQREIELVDIISGPYPLSEDEVYKIQVRYRSQPVNGNIKFTGEGSVRIRFTEAVRAIAPGQSAVIYKDNMVIAGGVISKAGNCDSSLY
jgi:tRNA-uridine 2-sulfurtransferase